MSSACSGSPAGRPSRIQVKAGPWLSPAVKYRRRLTVPPPRGTHGGDRPSPMERCDPSKAEIAPTLDGSASTSRRSESLRPPRRVSTGRSSTAGKPYPAPTGTSGNGSSPAVDPRKNLPAPRGWPEPPGRHSPEPWPPFPDRVKSRQQRLRGSILLGPDPGQAEMPARGSDWRGSGGRHQPTRKRTLQPALPRPFRAGVLAFQRFSWALRIQPRGETPLRRYCILEDALVRA